VLKPQQESYSPPNVSARDGFFSSLLGRRFRRKLFPAQWEEQGDIHAVHHRSRDQPDATKATTYCPAAN
jgi:hypothetical protein